MFFKFTYSYEITFSELVSSKETNYDKDYVEKIGSYW